MGLLSGLGDITGGFLGNLSKKWGWISGGETPYGENRIGNALNNFTGITDQMNASYQQQVASMQMQNAYNKAMWNAQNEYNSPIAQLARMREAGIDINPTSYALGTGNLSNTAALVNSEGGFAGSGSPAGNPISMLMGMATGIQGIREARARTDNIREQNYNIRAQADLTSANATRMENENAFFQKHGYYPPRGEAPLLSNVGGGTLASDIFDALMRGATKGMLRDMENNK